MKLKLWSYVFLVMVTMSCITAPVHYFHDDVENLAILKILNNTRILSIDGVAIDIGELSGFYYIHLSSGDHVIEVKFIGNMYLSAQTGTSIVKFHFEENKKYALLSDLEEIDDDRSRISFTIEERDYEFSYTPRPLNK